MSLLTSLIQTHLPAQCRLCGTWPCYGATRCCAACLRQWAQARPRCPGCARPMPTNTPPGQRCGACLTQPGPLTGVIAAMDYAFPWSHWAIDLKSESNMGLATSMAQFMATAWLRDMSDPQAWLWTCVPLHPDKLRQRGFNQAQALMQPCQQIADPELGRAVPGLLSRRRWTHDQHSLPQQRRTAAVADAFALSDDHAHLLDAPSARVVLVDDVMTTGATLSACARAIQQHISIPVHALVFARTIAKSG